MTTPTEALAATQDAHDKVSDLAGVPRMAAQLAAKDATIAAQAKQITDLRADLGAMDAADATGDAARAKAHQDAGG